VKSLSICVSKRLYLLQEFELIEKKELAPLQELIERLTSINTNVNNIEDQQQQQQQQQQPQQQPVA